MKNKKIALLLFVVVFVLCIATLSACNCKHTSTKDVVITAPTCNTAGSKNVVCNQCGEVLQSDVVIPATGQHVEKTTTQNATCGQAGSVTIVCELCDQVLYTQTLAKLDCSWGSWSVTTAPTTTADGERTRVCLNDGSHTQTEPVPMLNDTNYTVTHTESNCKYAGKDVYTSDEFGTFEVALPLSSIHSAIPIRTLQRRPLARNRA